MKQTLNESRQSLIGVSSLLKPREKFQSSNKDLALESLKKMEIKIEKSIDVSAKKEFNLKPQHVQTQNHNKPETQNKPESLSSRNFQMDFGEHLLPVKAEDEKFSISDIKAQTELLRFSFSTLYSQKKFQSNFVIDKEEIQTLTNKQIIDFCSSTSFSLLPSLFEESESQPQKNKMELIEPISPKSEMIIERLKLESNPSVAIQFDSKREFAVKPPEKVYSFEQLLRDFQSIQEEKEKALLLSDTNVIFELRQELNRQHEGKLKGLVTLLLKESGLPSANDLQINMKTLFENFAFVKSSKLSLTDEKTKDKVLRFFLKEYAKMEEIARHQMQVMMEDMPVKLKKSQEKSSFKRVKSREINSRKSKLKF